MGLRGVGAGRRHKARAHLASNPRDLPWQRPGLTRVARLIAFLEFLPVTKGRLEGRRMKLLPDQVAFVRAVYGPKGRKRVRLAIKSAPRGSGKTGLVAGLVLAHLVGPESEPRGEIYSAAIDREQAALVFHEVEAIVHAVPEFEAICNVVRHYKRVEVVEGPAAGSKYESLSADARRAHGLSPTLWVYDELAQAKTRALLDNLVTAAGKRKASLGIIISTQASDDTHPLSQLIDDAATGADPGVVSHVISAPEDADPFAEATVRACNPGVGGGLLDLDDLMAEADRARRIPAFEPSWRNLRLNQRCDPEVEGRLVSRAVWEANGGAVDEAALAGRPCFGGLDLSGKHDLTSLTLVFPGGDPEAPSYDILQRFWTPLGAMAQRPVREQDLFRQWIAAGFITGLDGPVIRYRQMAHELARLQDSYAIKAVAYDAWRIEAFELDMEEAGVTGLPLVKFGQGWRSMAPAVEFFVECALGGRLRHGNHPVLTACIVNAVTVSDPAGNLKVDKARSRRPGMTRIDGAITTIMALGAAQTYTPPPVIDVRAMIG